MKAAMKKELKMVNMSNARIQEGEDEKSCNQDLKVCIHAQVVHRLPMDGLWLGTALLRLEAVNSVDVCTSQFPTYFSHATL